MKNKTIYQIISAIIIILVMALLLNPFGIWMPDMLHIMVLGLFLAVSAVFVAFVMQEKGGDERDQEHRMFSGRIAFLASAFLAVCGIVYQALAGHIDPWLIATLCVMLLAKIGGNLYSSWYH